MYGENLNYLRHVLQCKLIVNNDFFCLCVLGCTSSFKSVCKCEIRHISVRHIAAYNVTTTNMST